MGSYQRGPVHVEPSVVLALQVAVYLPFCVRNCQYYGLKLSASNDEVN